LGSLDVPEGAHFEERTFSNEGACGLSAGGAAAAIMVATHPYYVFDILHLDEWDVFPTWR
jgi:hypothetical protein